MTFQAFNQTNNYFDAANLSQTRFLQGVAAYYKSKPNVAIFQACQRAMGGPTIQQGITTIYATIPANLVGQPKLNHVYQAVDNHWTNTMAVRGQQQLTNEQATRQAYWTTGQGANTVPTLDQYAKHGVGQTHLASLLITPTQVSGYVALLTAVIGPYLAETPFCQFNQNHKHAVDTKNANAALANQIALGNLTDDDGSYKANDSKWTTLEGLANYWIKEIPNVAGRLADYNAINTYGGGSGAVSLFRLVSEGEKDFVTKKHAGTPTIAQGPSSYERHKWFFGSTGAPGVGHAHKLEIKLKGTNAYTFLKSLAQEVNDESKSTSPLAVIKKSNETDCIGIHEELLAVFCSKMVSQIKEV